eukprot:5254284-Lingulodinium_polyedra.AAC.1
MGPISAEEMWKWGKVLMDQLMMDESRKERLEMNCRNGLVVGATYSGMHTAENAIVAMYPHILGTQGVHFLYSCDNGKVPTQICLNSWRSSEHHFHDINDRIPPAVRDFLDGI